MSRRNLTTEKTVNAPTAEKASAPEPVETAVTRRIDLDPEDWYVATWRDLPPLPRPQTQPYDAGDYIRDYAAFQEAVRGAR